MSKNSIPDRWLNYSKIGTKVDNTRFINFKVPLNKNINNRIEHEDERFTLDNLVEQVNNNTGHRLGLIIDLTNTNRYYNPMNLKDLNVEHAKILTEGHIVPSKAVRRKFFQCVESFFAKNKTDLIGIHCTHGVNRSGYLVCKYMITHLNIDPRKAISDFNTARGHDLERSNYIADLWNTKPSTNGLSELRSTEERVYWKERSRNHHETRNKQNKMKTSYSSKQGGQRSNHYNPYSRPSQQHNRRSNANSSYHNGYNDNDNDYRYNDEQNFRGYNNNCATYIGSDVLTYDNDYTNGLYTNYDQQNSYSSYEAGPSNDNYNNGSRQYYNMDTQENMFSNRFSKFVGANTNNNKATYDF